MNRTVLADLGRALRVLGEHGDRVSPAAATTEQLDEIAEDIQRARALLAEAERPLPATDCPTHPYGPVEPDTERACLLCTVRRRRGRRPDTRPAVSGRL